TSCIVKTGHRVMKKTLFLKLPVTIVVLLSAAVSISSYSMQQSANAFKVNVPGLGVPIATSGNSLYMAWPNNDTGHWNVFFAKSQISASGSNVYVTWWTNKTGTLKPVFRASNNVE